MPQITAYFGRIKEYALAHKVWSAIVAVALVGGIWWIHGKLNPAASVTHYTLGTVARKTVISAVSGSGQVSATNQINIQTKVSSTVTWVGVAAGDKVRSGEALVRLDDTTAQQSLSAAQKSLAASELQYQKDTAQAPISYQNDVAALATAKEDLQNTYNDTYNDLTTTYLNLPGEINAAQNTLYGYDFDSRKTQWNSDVLTNLFAARDTGSLKAFETSAFADSAGAKTAYDASLALYQQTPRTATSGDLEHLLAVSITTMTATAQALQSELNFLGTASSLAQTYNSSLPASFSSLQSTARSELATANSDLSTLLAVQKTISNGKQAIISDQQTITLDQVGNSDGNNPISLQIEKNNIEKSKEDIANQQAALANYTILAPFNGTISAVNVKVGDNVSGAVATIVSSAQVAELSLNEVDAAKISLGDKTTMTFDAIDGLTLTGMVAEIDPVGTVSQGVVSYNVQIAFDTQDPRVKPGMTINAGIQTAVHQNVLVVASTAVKTQNGVSSVQAFVPPIATSTVQSSGTQGILSPTPPASIPVTVGISDNTDTEILTGLNEGEQVVIRTTSGTTVPTAAAAATTRGGGGFGGGIRLGG